MSKEDAIKLFAPMFYNYKRSLLEPMNQEKIDEIEFLALSSLVFWDIGQPLYFIQRKAIQDLKDRPRNVNLFLQEFETV